MSKISKRTIQAAIPADKDYFIWDSELSGYGVKVTPKGKKTFVLQYRIGRQSRRMTLGAFGPFTAEQARSLAQAALRQVARGDDPMKQRDEIRNDQTFGELLDRFLIEHASARLKTRSSAEYQRLVERLITSKIRRTRISDIKRPEIAQLHNSLSATPYQANRLLAVLRKFFNWCEKLGFRPDNSNPTLHIDLFEEKKRERFLSPAEIAHLGEVLSDLEQEGETSPFVIGALRLLLLTGARLNEILTTKWEWVDFDNGCIRLPDSKTGAKTIYLSAPAMQLINAMPRLEDNPYVICGQKKGTHLVNLQKPWNIIRERAGLKDVRIHDLRHSFASVAVASGMSLPMIGKLLGHTQAQTTARYAHLADDPMKHAVGQISKDMDIMPKLHITN